MSASSQYYSVTARVGVPHRHEVEVTIPLVGPAGATGPAGAAGASAWNDISGKPSTFAPSAHASSHATGGSDPIAPAAIGLGATDSVTFEELNIVGAPIISPFAGEGVVNCNKLSLGTYTVDIGGGTPGDAFGSIVFAANDGNITISGPAGDITTSKSISIPNASGTLALTESADNVFRVVGSSDATKKVAFEVDGLSTATTRTLTVPNSSGTIALLETLPAGGTKTYAVFTATDNQPPASNFMTLDTRNGIAVLDADDATDESAVFVGVMPEGASLGSGLKIRLHWMATSATSGNCVWDVSLERMTTDLDSDSFDTIASATAAANGTSGILTVTEITLTTIDSVTAGDGFRLRVTRDANNGSDTMTGDAELVVVEVRSAA